MRPAAAGYRAPAGPPWYAAPAARNLPLVPTLGERIVEHLLTHGASLDDGELAEALGVRRSVIAEACRQLEERGLVVRNIAGGTRTVSAVQDGQLRPDGGATAPSGPITFAAHARRVLSARWGTSLQQRKVALPGGEVRVYELVSGNGRIVGDAVWLVERGEEPEAKWAAIAEAVLIIGHTLNADRRFLVFGQDWDVLSRWLARYRLLLGGVEVWWLDGDRLERLA